MELKRIFKESKFVVPAILILVVCIWGVITRPFDKMETNVIHGEETSLTETSDATEMQIVYESIVNPSVTSKVPIYVYICGAVNTPGVYEITSGVLLNDAIFLAGGLRDDAASDHLNLVMTINENMSIYIPTNEEVMDDLYSSEVIIRDDVSSDSSAGSEISSDKVNINSAGRAELMTVPGIGEVTADSIIAYRTANGPFKSIDELLKVDGIGQGKFNKFKDHFCV